MKELYSSPELIRYGGIAELTGVLGSSTEEDQLIINGNANVNTNVPDSKGDDTLGDVDCVYTQSGFSSGTITYTGSFDTGPIRDTCDDTLQDFLDGGF